MENLLHCGSKSGNWEVSPVQNKREMRGFHGYVCSLLEGLLILLLYQSNRIIINIVPPSYPESTSPKFDSDKPGKKEMWTQWLGYGRGFLAAWNSSVGI